MNYSPSDVEMFCGFVMCYRGAHSELREHKGNTARTLGHEGNQQENMERMRWGTNTFAIMAVVAVYHTLLLAHIMNSTPELGAFPSSLHKILNFE